MKEKLRIHDSFWFLISGIFLLDADRVFLALLVASIVHELGHFLMVKRYGGTIIRFHLSALGGLIQYWLPKASRYSELWIALSGPLAGLLLWQVAVHLHYPLLAGASLLLSIFNLFPAAPLAGGRALESCFIPGHWLPKTVRSISICVLLLAGVYSGISQRGWSLGLIAVCLLAQQYMALQSTKIRSKI